MMAHERSTQVTHDENPDQLAYDKAYWDYLLPHVTGDVLDIGAGGLMFTAQYLNKEDVTSVIAVDKFQEAFKHDKLAMKQWVYPDKLPGGKYDTIVSTEFIEHIERKQLEPLLEQVKARLKDDGKFIGSTPNKVVPTTNPYHLYEYTLEELKGILETFFKQVDIRDTGHFCSVWIASQPR
jgi:SAM-dependent methyltransferase